PVPAQRALRILAQLADALDYAHGEGVLHRDLKPANVLVGKGDHVTLLDFGLALAFDATRRTPHSQVVGTPEYMAPEGITTNSSSPSSDLYALGAVAYELLTGPSPFGKQNPFQVLYATVHLPPVSPRSLRGDLPEPAEAVLLRQLSKDPRDRFES